MEQLRPARARSTRPARCRQPVATACGLATLRESANPASTKRWPRRPGRLVDGCWPLRGSRRAVLGDSEGGMFGFFFATPPQNYPAVIPDKSASAPSSTPCWTRRIFPAPALYRGELRERGAWQADIARHHSSRAQGTEAAETATCTSTSLGICGYLHGQAGRAFAREAGHRVTGCDANVYPPMSDQLRSLGIELIEGWALSSWRLSRICSWSVTWSRARHADGSPSWNAGLPTPAARSGYWPTTCCMGRHGEWWPASHGKTDDHLDAGLDPSEHAGL